MPEILNTVNTLRMKVKAPVATFPRDGQNILGAMIWIGHGVTFKLDPERRRLSRNSGLDHQVYGEQGWAQHGNVRIIYVVHQSWTTLNIEHTAVSRGRPVVPFDFFGCP
jgi:hypothetical protein